MIFEVGVDLNLQASNYKPQDYKIVTPEAVRKMEFGVAGRRPVCYVEVLLSDKVV